MLNCILKFGLLQSLPRKIMDDSTALSNGSWNYNEQHALTRVRQGRSILSPAMISDPSASFTSLSLLDKINDYFKSKEKLENDIKAINQMMLMKRLREQLAPGQTAYVFQSKTSSGLTLDSLSENLPGGGILYDPEKMLVTQIPGPPLDHCPLPGRPSEHVPMVKIDNREYLIKPESDINIRNNNSAIDFRKDININDNNDSGRVP